MNHTMTEKSTTIKPKFKAKKDNQIIDNEDKLKMKDNNNKLVNKQLIKIIQEIRENTKGKGKV